MVNAKFISYFTEKAKRTFWPTQYLTLCLGDDFVSKQIVLRDFQSRWWHRLLWHVSSYNHIKITAEIYNNHHTEQSEIKLNGILTTMELKKPCSSTPLEGVEMWNGSVPHPRVVDKNSGRISWEQDIPAPHQDPIPDF